MKIGKLARGRRLRRVLAPFAFGLAAAAGTAYALRRPLPRINAVVWPGGLTSDVQLVRDRWGIPHIYAATLEDLIFAQGYAHAQDRLWQMELHRRAASGTLSELFGEVTLDADRLMRRIGLWRAARTEEVSLSDEARRVVVAYAAGVNAYVDGNRHRLPVEFTLLRCQPSAWTPLDSISIGKFLAWCLSTNWDTELIRARLINAIGPVRAARLEPGYPAGQPLTVPPGADFTSASLEVLESYREIAASLGLPSPGDSSSNSWAIDGSRTSTGKPLLANDPHLRPQMPALWYINHLEGDGLNVIGASLPGVPIVMIGHNERIAWGFTASCVDVQDLYIERFHEDDPGRYEFQGDWIDAERIVEEIRVRGRTEPVREQVLVTRHGPVISPSLDASRVGGAVLPLSLQSTVLQVHQGMDALLGLNRAQNWDDFRATTARWGVPTLNTVYADVDGNIGYQLIGKVPVRARGEGLVPVPGWTGEFEWAGTIPFEELPSVKNPESNAVISANNRIVGPEYPHHLSHEWSDGYRARRISDVLSRGNQFTVRDFVALQGDVLSLAAAVLLDYLSDVQPADIRSRQALALLRTWDRQVTADSPAAAIYEAVRLAILRNALGEVLGPELPHVLGSGIADLAPLTVYAARGSSMVFHLLEGLPTEERRRLLEQSLAAAVQDLTQRLGEEMTQWHWGKLHTISFRHPLGRSKALKRLLNRGPYPHGGDYDTVCQSGVDPAKPYEATGWTASYRQVIDLADFDRSVATLPTGQSGHPASRHYANRVTAWRRNECHPLLFSRTSVFANVEAILTLRAIRWPVECEPGTAGSPISHK